MQHHKSEININRSFKGKHTSSAQWKHQHSSFCQQLPKPQWLLMDLHNSFDHMFSGGMKWNQIWLEWYLKSIEIIRKKNKLGYILYILTLWKKYLTMWFDWQFDRFYTWEAFSPNNEVNQYYLWTVFPITVVKWEGKTLLYLRCIQ